MSNVHLRLKMATISPATTAGGFHFSIAGKVLVRILSRFVAHLNQGLLLDSQCGFRKGWVTVDIVFAAIQLRDKCREQNIDLTKAIDTVSCKGLWKIMETFGCVTILQWHACTGLMINPFPHLKWHQTRLQTDQLSSV